MSNGKMKWVVAVLAVGLLLGVGSMAAAIDLTYDLRATHANDIHRCHYHFVRLHRGADGVGNNSRRIRVYGYYNNDNATDPPPNPLEPEESQWMMPTTFYNEYNGR